MKKRVCLHDRKEIAAFLQRDTVLQVYSLGDLDDLFWPGTTWYGLVDGRGIRAVVLMYSALVQPTMLAIGSDKELTHLKELVASILSLLPRKFWAHLSLGLTEVLREEYRIESPKLHYKMGLMDAGRLERGSKEGIVRLTAANRQEVLRFYERSYPGHSFEPQMLDTGQYYGLKRGRRLVSVAGVHVYSPKYKVAALANIATRPADRGKGYGRAVISHLCRQLLSKVEHVGLNVRADNEAAIGCYKSLGFGVVGTYEEGLLEAPCQGEE